jgi:hypothetical protein
MLQRCGNPDRKQYPNYGGRGITVCSRWSLFENFLADMGLKPSPKHQIDRIDNEGNYEPGNCRWVLPVVNCNNRRGNVPFTIDGRTQTLAQWASEAGIVGTRLYHYVNRHRPELVAWYIRKRSMRELLHELAPAAHIRQQRHSTTTPPGGCRNEVSELNRLGMG